MHSRCLLEPGFVSVRLQLADSARALSQVGVLSNGLLLCKETILVIWACHACQIEWAHDTWWLQILALIVDGHLLVLGATS